MSHLSFEGRSILVIGEESAAVLEISGAFESAGAKVLVARSPDRAITLASGMDVSGAVLDQKFLCGDGNILQQNLLERGVPCVVYSVAPDVERGVGGTTHPRALMAAMAVSLGMAARAKRLKNSSSADG